MSANPMSLRRAVEIVEAGQPVAHHMRAPEWLAASNEHTRARSILAAAVEAHEAYEDARCSFGGAEKQAWVRFEAKADALRKLERGE